MISRRRRLDRELRRRALGSRPHCRAAAGDGPAAGRRRRHSHLRSPSGPAPAAPAGPHAPKLDRAQGARCCTNWESMPSWPIRPMRRCWGSRAGEFFERIVLGQLRACGMVEGQNFFFGHDRGGNIEVLGEFCRLAGIPLEVVEPVQIDGQVVSSSRVRTLISAGAGCGGRPAAHPALPDSWDGGSRPGPRKQAWVPDRQCR